MKLASFFLGLSFLTSFSAQANLARVELDQNSYSVGSRAVVFAYVDQRLENPNDEFQMEIESNGESMTLLQLSPQMAIGFLARFTSPGTQEASVSLYQRKKRESQELEYSLAYYEKENVQLQKTLEGELDSEAKKKIEARIARNKTVQGRIRSELLRLRSLLSIQRKSVLVSPANQKNILSSPITLSADRNPAIYSVGEKASFLLHLHTDFRFPDGPGEPTFSALVDGVTSLPGKKTGLADYSFSSPYFTSQDVGNRELQFRYFVRSKKQSDFLRLGISKVRAKKTELEKQLQGSTNLEAIAYFQFEIQKYMQVLSALENQLLEIRLEVASEQLSFEVTN